MAGTVLGLSLPWKQTQTPCPLSRSPQSSEKTHLSSTCTDKGTYASLMTTIKKGIGLGEHVIESLTSQEVMWRKWWVKRKSLILHNFIPNMPPCFAYFRQARRSKDCISLSPLPIFHLYWEGAYMNRRIGFYTAPFYCHTLLGCCICLSNQKASCVPVCPVQVTGGGGGVSQNTKQLCFYNRPETSPSAFCTGSLSSLSCLSSGWGCPW